MTEIITIHNVETDETATRPMTAEELSWLEAARVEPVPSAEELERQAKRQALLDRLGITQEEAKLLLG